MGYIYPIHWCDEIQLPRMLCMTSSTPSTTPATPTTQAIPMSPASPARPVRLGPHDVFPLALGCMGMSDMYGASDEAESVATIQAAIDRGVNLLDTGDFYARGANELLLGRALRGRRDQ